MCQVRALGHGKVNPLLGRRRAAGKKKFPDAAHPPPPVLVIFKKGDAQALGDKIMREQLEVEMKLVPFQKNLVKLLPDDSSPHAPLAFIAKRGFYLDQFFHAGNQVGVCGQRVFQVGRGLAEVQVGPVGLAHGAECRRIVGRIPVKHCLDFAAVLVGMNVGLAQSVVDGVRGLGVLQPLFGNGTLLGYVFEQDVHLATHTVYWQCQVNNFLQVPCWHR